MTRVCAECGRTVYPNAEGHTHGVTGPSATEGSSLDTDLATLRRIIESVRPDAVPALGRVEDELSRLRGLIEGSATDEAILQAAEARCARLQQALWAEVRWQEEEYGSRHPARDILEGPDTPADSHRLVLHEHEREVAHAILSGALEDELLAGGDRRLTESVVRKLADSQEEPT